MFLSIGMNTQEYWDGDPYLVRYYLEAYRLRRQRMSEELWLSGIYIRSAIGSAMDSKNKYIPEPIRITELSEKEKEIEKQKAIQSVIGRLTKLKSDFDKRNGG